MSIAQDADEMKAEIEANYETSEATFETEENETDYRGYTLLAGCN